MSIDKNSDENIQNPAEADYEELVGQEEIYIEEIEERGRAVLISEQPTQTGLSPDTGSLDVGCVTDASNTGMADGVDEQLEQVVEELITGDSDDPPLSDEVVVKMLRTDRAISKS